MSQKKANAKAAEKPAVVKRTPGIPGVKAVNTDTSDLPITDPRRKLTKEERKALSPEDRKARRAAKQANRAPYAMRTSLLLTKFANKLGKISKMLSENKEIAESVHGCAEMLRDATIDLQELPEDFRPAKLRDEAITYKPGSFVRLTDAKQEQYAELLDEKDMVGLKVISQTGKNVALEAPHSKIRIVLPAGHVRPEMKQAKAG